MSNKLLIFSDIYREVKDVIPLHGYLWKTLIQVK